MFLYKAMPWWPNAFHVSYGEKRIGFVSRRDIRFNNRKPQTYWIAHNINFMTIPGRFDTRTDAAEAIPKGPIHQPVEAFS